MGGGCVPQRDQPQRAACNRCARFPIDLLTPGASPL
jgi:hypothetical protein